MALVVTDFAAGGSIRRQGYLRNRDFAAYYVREFKPGVSLGRSGLSSLESDVGVTATTADAARLMTRIAAVLGSRPRRKAFVRGVLQDAGWDQAGVQIAFGGVRGIAGGDAAFVAPLTLLLPGKLRLSMLLEVVRVDRAVQVISLLSAANTPIVVPEATRLVGRVADRMRAGLIPANLGAPTISGEALVGKTIAAGVGSWTNSPTAFVFQWLRCSAAGCAPIDSATATDYLLTPADIGSTIEVSVSATNSVGSSAPVVSVPSGVVS